jgi:hypothetical protein
VAFPGALAVGARHVDGAGEDPRVDRPAAFVAGGRGRRDEPQPVLTGWAGYFRRGNSTAQFHKLDLYTAERLARWIGKRHKSRRPLAYGYWRLPQERFFGLRPLVGRVHHGAAHAAK